MMLNLDYLLPMMKFASDFGKVLIHDDRHDLAFPTRYHPSKFHHFHWGIGLVGIADAATELISVYKIIQQEKWMPNDTLQSFVNRCVSIHKKTYVPQDNSSNERIEALSKYFRELRNTNSKSDLEHRLEDAIYMGKIKTKSQMNPTKKKKKSPKPVRLPPPASQGKITLYRPKI